MFRKTIVIVAFCCMTAILAKEIEKSSPQIPNGLNNQLVTESNVMSSTDKPTTKTTATTIKPTTSKTPPPSPPPTNATTSSTTTSTTPAATTTTTTAKPTPPPTPAPPVNPTQGKWSINDTITNKTCIMLDMAIHFDIIVKNNNVSSKVHINVPSNATATGNCGNDTQIITLTWSPIINVTDFITFNFTKTNTSGFDLAEIIAKLNVSLPGKETQVYNLSHKKKEFVTPLNKSYKCYKEQILNLTVENMVGVSSVLKINQVQMEAFHNTTSRDFSDAMDCMGSETPDVVPIAVGCALAALVIIVLIVYLMGRRRSQARGYLSMFTETKREEDYIPMKNLSCFQ